MGYGLVLISHATDKTFTDEQGQEYNKIVPTLDKRATNIVSRMTDIIGYSRVVTNDKGELETKLFMRGTPRYMAGSRFKYTPEYIDFSYDNLVKAIGEAIDKQASEDGKEYFTEEKSNAYQDTTKELDFDELVSTFNDIVSGIIESAGEEKFVAEWQPKIIQITDKYLGRGNKVNQCDRNQVEAISLIVSDLQDLVK